MAAVFSLPTIEYAIRFWLVDVLLISFILLDFFSASVPLIRERIHSTFEERSSIFSVILLSVSFCSSETGGGDLLCLGGGGLEGGSGLGGGVEGGVCVEGGGGEWEGRFETNNFSKVSLTSSLPFDTIRDSCIALSSSSSIPFPSFSSFVLKNLVAT